MPIIGMATSNFCLVKDIFESVRFAWENGFSGIEIWSDVPHCYVDDFSKEKAQRKKLQALLKESLLKVSLHSPISGINIASVNHGIRKESIRQVKAAVDLAQDLSSELLVIHPGKKQSILPIVKEMGFNLNIQSITEIKNYAMEKGVKVILENCGVETDDWEENLEDFTRLVNACDIKVCLDVGHAHCSWGLKETFEALKDKIIHIHMHDNDKSYDQHLPVGMGSINYEYFTPFLKEFSGMIIHEVQYPKDYEGATLKSKKELDKLLEEKIFADVVK